MFPFLPQGPLKDNIAYTLILSDTIHWLLVRTDVTNTIKEQLIKLHMFLLGSLVESITKTYLQGKCGKGKNYKERTAYLAMHELISQQLKVDLDWLWDMRNNMHLFLLPNSEYICPHYTVPEHDRAVRAIRTLVKTLKLEYTKRP